MENFQYSVQLSDQDWAEFSATADECGLLQASLASGDELLSSDIDQGDSSGSSPPGPLPLLSGQLAPAGSCWQGCEEEDDVASRWLVSRSLCEPALAPGPSQQTLGTSARSRAWPPLGSGATAPGQCSSLPGPASGHEMQRLLQGPVPGPPGEPPRSPESAGCSTTLQRPPDSPGPPPRSPGRKKRRTMGAKGGGRMGALGPGAAQLGSLPLTEASLDEGLGLAGPKGKGLRAGTAALTAGAGQDWLQTDSRGVPELSTRREPDSMLPAPDCVLEGPAGPLRAPVRTELCPSSTPVKEVHADIAMSKPDVTLSTPASEPQPDVAGSTPASEPQLNMAGSTPTSEPQLNMAGSTPTSEPQFDMAGSTPASKTQPNMAGSTPASKTQPDVAGSTPASEPQPDVAGSTPASKTQPDVAGSTPASEPQPDVVGSTPASKTQLNMAGSTPTSEPQLDMAGSTPASKTQPNMAGSTPASKTQPDVAGSTPASEPQPDVAGSTPASKTQLNMAGSTPTSEPQLDMAGSTPASKTQPNMAGSTPASKTQPDVAGSTPASEPQPDVAGSTPTSKTQLNMAGSTPTSEPQLDMAGSTPASKTQPNMAGSTPASKTQPDVAGSTPASEPQPDVAGSTPASESKLDMDLLTARLVVKPEDLPTPALVAASPTAPPHSVSKVESYMGVSADAPRANAAAPSPAPAPQAGLQMGGAVREQVTGAPSAEAPGQHSGGPSLGPAPGPRRKKVRFSVATPSPEEPGSRGVLSLRSPVARTAAEGRRGPGTWDAAAVGTHPPQPRILKHLPPPAPSSPGGSGPGMGFAVTLPEAYEFFFCDTIEEGDEGAEEEAVDSQALAQAQWPDMCEFFFRDCGSQRPKSLQGSPAAPAPKAEPVPAPPPGSPVPMSIPEAYEHFFGEDRCGGMLGPSTLLQPHTLEPPRLAPWELRPGPPPKPSPGAAEQLSLVVRQAGELRGPLTSFTFSQKDMCLVFVAFATWAVRTSDLQTPDAWKTVLLANIGTISAIRYFRRQVGQGRSSCSPSPGHSPSSSRSPSPGHSPSS